MDRANAALIGDTPRIVRSDMTRMGEMLSKYRGLRALMSVSGREDVAGQIEDVEVVIGNLRDALEHVLTGIVASNAPSQVGPVSDE